MVALIVARVPAPAERAVGAGEHYGMLSQGAEDLLWRDETGRRLGFGHTDVTLGAAAGQPAQGKRGRSAKSPARQRVSK